VCEAIVAALSGSLLGEGSPQTGVVESFGVGGTTLADETELEAAMLWGAQNDELSSLVKCFLAIVTKEARKRRADDVLPEKLSFVHDERTFRFDLDRTLADDGLAADQHFAAVQEAAKEFVEAQQTALRHCALALRGKQSAFHDMFACSSWPRLTRVHRKKR
jgi:hypothetical protein